MGVIAETHGEIAGISNDDLTTEGWIDNAHDVGPGTNFTMTQRQDFRGNGGNYCIVNNTTTASSSKETNLNLDRNFEEGFIRVPLARMADSASPFIVFKGIATGETTAAQPWEIEVTLAGDTEIKTNNSLQSVSAGNIPTSNTTWTVLEFWIRHSSTSGSLDGHVKIYRDFDYSSPWVEHVGRVDRTSAALDGLDTNQIRVELRALTGLDDVKVQDITLSYTSGAGGAIAAGDTIRVENVGTTTIGKADVVSVIGDATSGKLVLRKVRDGSAVEWDAIMNNSPFATGVSVIEDGGGGWSATCGDLDADSGLAGNGYFAAARVPQTLNSGASTPFSFFGGTTAVDSVDDGLDSTQEGNYIYTTTSGDNDVYDFGTLLPAAGDIDAIIGATMYFRGRKDGTGIDNYRVQTKEDTNAIEEAAVKALTADWTVYPERYRLNPRTDVDWTHTSLGDTDFGLTFEA